METTLRMCAACSTTNRVPVPRLADEGRCGRCKASLPPLDTPLDVDGPSFEGIVRNATVPVLVDFWAPWCGPCRMAAPEVQRLARELAGQAIILKVNTEENAELSGRLRIQSIPTFMVFQNGQRILQKSGVAPRSEMRRWVEQAAEMAAR